VSGVVCLLATMTEPFDDPEWIFELKYDASARSPT
jgi:hypothetical protein